VPFFSAPKLTDDEALRSYARVLVRSGLFDEATCVREVAVAAREDAGRDDADEVARSLVTEAREGLDADAQVWPERTDYDALQEALGGLERRGYAVLQGAEDHWAAARVVREAPGRLRGVVWFTPSDVWHAVEHGMLEVNVWHADSANIADGDPLCAEVTEALQAVGLPARFDEGRIEVTARWHRRVPDPA
jgi:hypothetical protein